MPNPDDPNEAECQRCFDSGLIPGSYYPCVCTGLPDPRVKPPVLDLESLRPRREGEVTMEEFDAWQRKVTSATLAAAGICEAFSTRRGGMCYAPLNEDGTCPRLYLHGDEFSEPT